MIMYGGVHGPRIPTRGVQAMKIGGSSNENYPTEMSKTRASSIPMSVYSYNFDSEGMHRRVDVVPMDRNLASNS